MSLPPEISRREAVRRMSLLVGGALSSSTVTALLSGCDPAAAPSPRWRPEALTGQQLDRLTVVVDRIVPPTDTPGAAEAGVPSFIDGLLAKWAEPDERARVLEGLDGLDGLSAERHGAAFLELDADEQTELLMALDAEAARAREGAATSFGILGPDGEDDGLPWFATVKEWTLVGYYTSEVGATQELRWLALPGRWDGDVPLSEVGRAWA